LENVKLMRPRTHSAYSCSLRFFQQSLKGEVEWMNQVGVPQPVENVFHVSDKARRFHNTFQRYNGIVNSHLYDISEEFPTAVLLLEHFDMQASYSGKMVIHAGDAVQEIFDGNQQSQSFDWALLDIFAPFRAEWCEGLEFGSQWRKWVEDIAAAVETLRKTPEQRVAARAGAFVGADTSGQPQ
jgi:hypothetical protein